MILIYGILMGFIAATAISMIIDNRKAQKDDEWLEQLEEALTGSDFCQVGCNYYEDCFTRYVDKNIAMDELYHNYCYNCPVRMATELVEQRKRGY